METTDDGSATIYPCPYERTFPPRLNTLDCRGPRRAADLALSIDHVAATRMILQSLTNHGLYSARTL